MSNHRIDWSAVISQIRATELTLDEIAVLIQASKGTVVNLLHDTHEPLHARGERVVQLWTERTGQDRNALPMVEVVRTLTAS